MKIAYLAATLFAPGLLCALSTQAQTTLWSGPYVTIAAGANQAPSHADHLIFDTNLDGTFGDTVKTYSGSDLYASGGCTGEAAGPTPEYGCYDDANRAALNARIGYDWQIGHLILGLLADYNGLKLTDAVSAYAEDPSLGPDSYILSRSFKSITAIRGRLGYTHEEWMAYATAGGASAKLNRTFMTTNDLNTFTVTDGDDAKGYQAGLGFERHLDLGWSVGLEYLHTSLDDKGVTVHAGPGAGTFASNAFLIANASGTDIQRSSDKLNIDSMMVTVSYRFGGL